MPSKVITPNDLKTPTLFAMNVLDITPLRYQADFLEDDSDHILIVGGRQIGKSTMLAIKALWSAFVKKNEDILIIAPTYRQSKIVYERIMEMIGRVEFIAKHTVRMNIEETRFDNNSSIRCLTSGLTGENVRGYTATMIFFDEASLIPDTVFVAIEPALAVKGAQLILSGTPYGKRGYFYNNFANNPLTKRWSIYQIKTSQNPLVEKTYLQSMRRVMTEAQYKQEFEAEFIDDVGLFYPIELIYSCSEPYEYTLETSPDYDYYIGADISRSGDDETAIVVLAVPKDESKKLRVTWVETISYPDLTAVANEIIQKANLVGAKRVFIDMIGVGAGVLDMCNLAIGSVAKGVELLGAKREQAYSSLKVLLEKKRLVLNMNDDKMRSQFASFHIEEGVAGGIHIRKERMAHEDLVDALVLVASSLGDTQKFLVFEGFEDLTGVFRQWTYDNLLREIKATPGTINNAYSYGKLPLQFYDDETGETIIIDALKKAKKGDKTNESTTQ